MGLDAYGSRYRKKRFSSFVKLAQACIAEKGSCRIIDVGGEYGYWRPFRTELQGLPLQITITNLSDRTEAFEDERFSFRTGNATDLDFVEDNEFDLVHSNSVIEHVGRWGEMSRMASEVRRVGRRYFVQTPYYWFPMEPHYRTIGYQWMPEQWRARLHMKRQLGFYPKTETFDQAMRDCQRAQLLDQRQMRELFPDAEIVKEKVGPLTKSLIAMRHA
ncbi:class I SAM-dependent methyltransferase [Methylobacterium sp. A54F]